jgi:8-oxo-dGDP phosphatase
MVGTADAENLLFIGQGAEHTGAPADINEARKVEWIDLASVPERIARGEIVGAASVVGLLAAMTWQDGRLTRPAR